MHASDEISEGSRKRLKRAIRRSRKAAAIRFVSASRSGSASDGDPNRKSTQYLITMEYHKLIDLLGIAVPILCALILWSVLRSLVRSWLTIRRQEKNRRAGRVPRVMVVPATPPVDRRKASRTLRSGAWVDPNHPDVINLPQRGARRAGDRRRV